MERSSGLKKSDKIIKAYYGRYTPKQFKTANSKVFVNQY